MQPSQVFYNCSDTIRVIQKGTFREPGEGHLRQRKFMKISRFLAVFLFWHF